MYSSYITSTITLGTRGLSPFSYNDYLHGLSERYPFAYSSCRTSCCCSCCANSMYRTPTTPSYCYDLYGSRQSSLIQWSPCRKVCLGGLDRCYYSRLPACDVDRRSGCDKGCSSRERSKGRKKGGWRKCMVFEERDHSYEIRDMGKAEAILSLLTDDVAEECFYVRRESKIFCKQPIVDKRENGGVRSKYESKKNIVDSGVLESDAKCEFEMVVSDSRKRDTRRSEKIEKENWKAGRMDEKTEALVRKARQKAEEKEEEEYLFRKENSNGRRVRDEEREELLRREQHRRRVSKDGSSCSSYYSFSSAGDYENENDVELKEERYSGDSSHQNESIMRRNEIDYQEAGGECKIHEVHREDTGVSLTKKTSAQESHASSSIVESDFRKKSEKKLLDTSVEDAISRKGTMEKESQLPVVRETRDGKSSNYSMRNEDRKVRSSERSELNLQKKQIDARTGVEVSRQSESKMKYKHLGKISDTNTGDVKTSYSSEENKKSKDEKSAIATSSSQTAVGLSNREDDFQRNSRKVTVVSDTIDVDIRKTSVSVQEFETSVKRTEDHSSIISEKKHLYDEVKDQVEPRAKSQQLDKGDQNLSLKTQSDNKLTKQGENVNSSRGSYLGSEKRQSQSHAYFIKREDSRHGSDKLTNTSTTHSGDSTAIVVQENNKTKSGTVARPSSSHSGPSRITTDKVSDAGQPIEFTSPEDAIGSASRLEESSEHYVGEFVDSIRQEIMNSEVQREKKTYETRLVHEEQKEREGLVQHTSIDSESKEHGSRQASQGSGAKGPSDEIWKVDESFTGEPSKSGLQENANKGENSIVKRTGRSLWNVIGDVLRLKWSPQSEIQSEKTGGRISPIKSTSSETWFSGHEAEENESASGKKEITSMIQELEEEKEEKTRSQFGKSSSSSTLVGITKPFSSVALESGSASMNTHLPFTGETSRSNSGSTSNAAVTAQSSISSPSLRLQRSPVVRSVSEGGEANLSDSVTNEQQNSGSVEQSGPAGDEVAQKGRGKLQRKDQILKDRFDEWEEAYRFDAEQRKLDELFMREALLEAQKAGDNWEVPVGAVLVHNGTIIARGYNLVEELRDSTAHAEMICIREGSSLLRTWRLSETTLYVTLEPCPMCAGAILQARIDTVVWGAPNKLLGADGSWIRLFPNGEGGNSLEHTDKPTAPVHPFHPKIRIRRGVLASECADTMQQFFQLRRKRKDKKPEPSSPPSSRLSISQHPSKLLKKMHDTFHIMFCM